MKGVSNGIVLLLGLSLKHDFLDVVEGEGTKNGESSPKPNVEQGFGLGEENGSNGDSHHSTASNGESTTPVHELFRGGHHGDRGKGCHGHTGSERSLSNSEAGRHLDHGKDTQTLHTTESTVEGCL